MTKNKLKKEYIILAVVILALLLYLLFRNPDRVNYELPELEVLSKTDIDKIEVRQNDELIQIVKNSNGDWEIQPKGYPAEKTKIENTVEAIADLSISTLVSESKNYSLYGLDEKKKIQVKAFAQEDMLRQFEVGNQASTYRHTFVRLPEDNSVYHADNGFRNHFEQEVKDLRNKSVLTFDTKEIQSVSISYENGSISMNRQVQPVAVNIAADKAKGEQPTTPQTEELWILADGKPAKKTEIDNMLNSLSSLSCDEFIEGKEKADFTEPIHTITVKGTKDYSLQIFKKTEGDDGKYPAVSSENAYVFLLGTYTAENLMKKSEDLMEEIEEIGEEKDKKTP